jgi:hypothetical protein
LVDGLVVVLGSLVGLVLLFSAAEREIATIRATPATTAVIWPHRGSALKWSWSDRRYRGLEVEDE